MIAPVPAPSTPPPKVPFSRVDSGCPEHPASAKAPMSTIAAAAITLPLDFFANLNMIRLLISMAAVGATRTQHNAAYHVPTSLGAKTFNFRVELLGITWYHLKITEDSRKFLPT